MADTYDEEDEDDEDEDEDDEDDEDEDEKEDEDQDEDDGSEDGDGDDDDEDGGRKSSNVKGKSTARTRKQDARSARTWDTATHGKRRTTRSSTRAQSSKAPKPSTVPESKRKAKTSVDHSIFQSPSTRARRRSSIPQSQGKRSGQDSGSGNPAKRARVASTSGEGLSEEGGAATSTQDSVSNAPEALSKATPIHHAATSGGLSKKPVPTLQPVARIRALRQRAPPPRNLECGKSLLSKSSSNPTLISARDWVASRKASVQEHETMRATQVVSQAPTQSARTDNDTAAGEAVADMSISNGSEDGIQAQNASSVQARVASPPRRVSPTTESVWEQVVLEAESGSRSAQKLIDSIRSGADNGVSPIEAGTSSAKAAGEKAKELEQVLTDASAVSARVGEFLQIFHRRQERRANTGAGMNTGANTIPAGPNPPHPSGDSSPVEIIEMETDAPILAVGEPQPPAAPQASHQGSSQPPQPSPPLQSTSNPGPLLQTTQSKRRGRS
ncbi:hypothetical protein RSOL_064640, partial [Rhizoctonia solani AG-3 Rhs1AP]